MLCCVFSEGGQIVCVEVVHSRTLLFLMRPRSQLLFPFGQLVLTVSHRLCCSLIIKSKPSHRVEGCWVKQIIRADTMTAGQGLH